MRVYVLQLESRAVLSRAFDRVMESDDVESCTVEADEMRLRFLAPTAYGDALVEHVYQDGGLTWCSRHDLTG